MVLLIKNLHSGLGFNSYKSEPKVLNIGTGKFDFGLKCGFL